MAEQQSTGSMQSQTFKLINQLIQVVCMNSGSTTDKGNIHCLPLKWFTMQSEEHAPTEKSLAIISS